MAITNPRKKFNFRFTILGGPQIPVFAAQKVTISDSVIDEVPHGFGNTQIKTAGQIKAGTMTIDRILDQSDSGMAGAIFKWHWQAQNPALQVGGDPLDYKKIIQVDELGLVGGNLAVINTYYAIGAWPSTMNGKEFDRMASENTVESIIFSVDYISMDTPVEDFVPPATALGG